MTEHPSRSDGSPSGHADETCAADAINDRPTAPRKGYWSMTDFSAPRIGRSTAVATDLELIAELIRRGKRDPSILGLMRLMLSMSPEPRPSDAGLMAGIVEPKLEGEKY